MKLKNKEKRIRGDKTRIEFGVSYSEDGGDVFLTVVSENSRTAERMFGRLHKKYCTISKKADSDLGYQ